MLVKLQATFSSLETPHPLPRSLFLISILHLSISTLFILGKTTKKLRN